MIALAATPISNAVAILAATFLMVFAGVGKKRLSWRAARCPVCNHVRTGCTCRWR
jgi:hypothetical protein